MWLWIFQLFFITLNAASLDEALDNAFLNNPKIYIPYYETAKREAQLWQTETPPNFIADYAIQWGRNKGPKIEGGILAPLTEWLARPLVQKIQLNSVLQSFIETYETSLLLTIEVERNYARVTELKKQRDLYSQKNELAQAAAQLKEAQYRAGNVNSLDWSSALASSLIVTQEYQKSERLFEEAQTDLNISVGSETTTSDLPLLFNVEIVPELALRQNLKLEKLRWEAEIIEAEIKSKPWWRSLDLNFGLTFERERDGAKILGPGLTTQIPLFDYGQFDRARLKAELQKTHLLIAFEEIRVRDQIKNLTRQIEKIIQTIQTNQKNLTILDRSLKEGSELYAVMNLSPYAMISTFQQKIDTEIALSELKLELHSLILSLEELNGVRLCRKELALTPESKEETILSENLKGTPFLPYKMVEGVKEFHLTIEPVLQTFAPGFTVQAWGVNGSTPGPAIHATVGERVRILVTNNLPESTTIHWHGIAVPWRMDGVVGLNQPPIKPGETYTYEFTLPEEGTYMYHSHADEMTQIALGVFGFFIVHPKEEIHPVDHDFLIFLHEWYIPPGSSRPDPMVMTDFNYFTFNGKVFPATEKMVVKKGDKVRIRLANLSMDSHPIHLHGHSFTVVRRGAKRLNESAQYTENTVDVPPGSTRDIEFIANNPGLWAFHCHKSHHVFNGMSHDFPNMIGVDPVKIIPILQKFFPHFQAMGLFGMGEMFEGGHHHHGQGPANFLPFGSPGPFGTIEMGGMFSILQVDE